jgi:hypothetical protein
MSGGAAGMLSSRYACRVFAGMEVTSECRALGVGGTAGIGDSEGPGGGGSPSRYLGGFFFV